MLFAISTSLLIFADSTGDLIIAYIFLALANGQASGALQSWFDNNYKRFCHEEDPKREIYREFLGRATMFIQYTGSIVFLVGGIIASFLNNGRIIVFAIQALGLISLAIFFAVVLNITHDEKKEEVGYFSLLKEGLAFSFSDRMISLYVIASVLLIAITIVWYNLVLFVIYFGYTGSDVGAGTLRWMIWFFGAMLMGKAGTISKKLSEKPWIPRLSFVFTLAFFGLTALLIKFDPFDRDNPSFDLVGVFFVFLIFVSAGFFMNIYNFLTQKFFLEIVPDKLRNSIYSLLPTLGLLVGAVLIFLVGSIIENSGFVWGIFIIIVVALTGVLFEYLALNLYEPPEDVDDVEELDILYDNYSIANFDTFFHKVPRAWQFSPRVKVIWDRLTRVALHDHLIDKDEKELLDSIMANLKEYGKILEDALDDHVITEEEKIELLLARTKLLQEAEEVAGKDDVITDEEAKIIDKLMKIVHELHLDHHSPDFKK